MLFVVILFVYFTLKKVVTAPVQSCTFHGSPHGRRAGATLVLGWGAPRGTVHLKLVLTRNSFCTGTYES